MLILFHHPRDEGTEHHMDSCHLLGKLNHCQLYLTLYAYCLRMQVALKCADLGHLASENRVHRKWIAALEEGMFRQGDLEKARGHPSVSPLMDRDKGGITRSQPGVSWLRWTGYFIGVYPTAA